MIYRYTGIQIHSISSQANYIICAFMLIPDRYDNVVNIVIVILNFCLIYFY